MARGAADTTDTGLTELEAAQKAKDERIVALEAELAAVREAAAAAPAEGEPGTAALLERIVGVVEQLAEAKSTPAGGALASFAANETAAAVLATLAGTVSVGEHSGRYTPDGGDDPELAIPVKFRSKGSEFNVIRTSRTRIVELDGTPRTTQGVHYSFSPAGMFETTDMAVVEYLRSRPTYNVEFWEIGNEPDRAPDVEPMLHRIALATAHLDDDELAAIQAEESEGHAREAVLKAVTVARRTVRGMAAADEATS